MAKKNPFGKKPKIKKGKGVKKSFPKARGPNPRGGTPPMIPPMPGAGGIGNLTAVNPRVCRATEGRRLTTATASQAAGRGPSTRDRQAPRTRGGCGKEITRTCEVTSWYARSSCSRDQLQGKAASKGPARPPAGSPNHPAAQPGWGLIVT